MYHRLLRFMFCCVFSVAVSANEEWLTAAKKTDIPELERLYWDETQEEAYKLINPELWRWGAFKNSVELLNWLNSNSCRDTHPGKLELWLLAASSDGTEVLDWLLKHNIDGRDAINKGGQNLWFQAVRHGGIRVLDWLYVHRDVLPPMDAVDPNGHNLWLVGEFRNDPDIRAWLEAHGVTRPALGGSHWREAARLGQTTVLEVLWRNQAPGAEELDEEGLNTWWFAVQFGHAAVIDFLVEHNIRGFDLRNLWRLAARAGNLEVLKRLRYHHIAGGDTLPDQGTIWLIATARGYVHILEWLHEIDFPGRNAVNLHGENMWGVATRTGGQRVMRWIMERIPGEVVRATLGTTIILPVLTQGILSQPSTRK